MLFTFTHKYILWWQQHVSLCLTCSYCRYYHLLKKGFTVVWTKTNYTEDERTDVHRNLFYLATDLSMLKLFEAFLESVPQLLLQLYIVMLGHQECSVLRCK